MTSSSSHGVRATNGIRLTKRKLPDGKGGQSTTKRHNRVEMPRDLLLRSDCDTIPSHGRIGERMHCESHALEE